MLQKLAEHIAGCFERATAFQRRAIEASDPEVRRSYEEIANAWRHLAASYQFCEALEDFLLDRDHAKKPPAPSIAPEPGGRRKNLREVVWESPMPVETEQRVMECLDMASDAARKAEAAGSPGEAQFWLTEWRWLRLAPDLS